MEKDVELAKLVVGRVVSIEEVSPTEPIIVGRIVEGATVSEVGMEVVSIEEGRETIFEVEKDVMGRNVVGAFVVDCWVVRRSEEGEEVVKDGEVVFGRKVDGGRVEGSEVTKQQLQCP